mmetsp:Transcript_37533/g.98425  ORF Transcript_37533/g.98425 Transcript_37533/m.98425 type:complete len:200 (-) Transcript_37533:716-1315(-)
MTPSWPRRTCPSQPARLPCSAAAKSSCWQLQQPRLPSAPLRKTCRAGRVICGRGARPPHGDVGMHSCIGRWNPPQRHFVVVGRRRQKRRPLFLGLRAPRHRIDVLGVRLGHGSEELVRRRVVVIDCTPENPHCVVARAGGQQAVVTPRHCIHLAVVVSAECARALPRDFTRAGGVDNALGVAGHVGPPEPHRAIGRRRR